VGIMLDAIVIGHCASMCPELGDNKTSFGVNGVYNLQARREDK
jgi:hypothetical protein